jgi:hypothetical protein
MSVRKQARATTSAQAVRQTVQLLGGVQRVRTRVRGFAPWSPEKATLALLDQVRGVLSEYADHLPLTIRQIFYRLVGAPLDQLATDAPLLAQHAIEHTLIDALLDCGAQDVGEHVGWERPARA